jgi:hypothetical protein
MWREQSIFRIAEPKSHGLENPPAESLRLLPGRILGFPEPLSTPLSGPVGRCSVSLSRNRS